MIFALKLTGATGYIGGHILQQLLEAGYRVRASVILLSCVSFSTSDPPVHLRTARPAKVDALREKLGAKVEVVPVDDLATGDYTEALKGTVDRYPNEEKNN